MPLPIQTTFFFVENKKSAIQLINKRKRKKRENKKEQSRVADYIFKVLVNPVGIIFQILK